MEDYTIIHTVTINNTIFYLHDYILKKFDYFKPQLEGRYSGNFTVNFDIEESNFDIKESQVNIINNFIRILYKCEVVLQIDLISKYHNWLDYLICNDSSVYSYLGSCWDTENKTIDIIIKNKFNPIVKMSCFNKYFKDRSKYCIEFYNTTICSAGEIHSLSNYFGLRFIMKKFFEKIGLDISIMIIHIADPRSRERVELNYTNDKDCFTYTFELPSGLNKDNYEANRKYTDSIIDCFIKKLIEKF